MGIGGSTSDSGHPENTQQCCCEENGRESGANKNSGHPENLDGPEIPEDAVLALQSLGWCKADAEKRVRRAWQRLRERQASGGEDGTGEREIDVNELILEAVRG